MDKKPTAVLFGDTLPLADQLAYRYDMSRSRLIRYLIRHEARRAGLLANTHANGDNDDPRDLPPAA